MLVSDLVVSTFLAFLSAEPPAVQAYAARTLYEAALSSYAGGSSSQPSSPLQRDSGGVPRRQPRLERVAVYVLGEHGHLVVGVTDQSGGAGLAPDAVGQALSAVTYASVWSQGEGAFRGGPMESAVAGAAGATIGDEIGRVRSHALTALVKLAVRTGAPELVASARKATSTLSSSRDVETQQRAVEYHALLEGPLSGVAAAALAPLPPMDYAAARRRLLASGVRRTTGTALVTTGLVSLLDGDFMGGGGGASAVAPASFGGARPT
eukprot:TRINITY_DN1245_c0_g1_i2.p3 TRINITY_DN1245_c0_g1~~TRINITY_DN1245_c0_g1_i2.p3  ORF type:complete len:265 (+),score=78.20 TRINITY_DN1245_c0_g1_i2:923-1717(+)